MMQHDMRRMACMHRSVLSAMFAAHTVRPGMDEFRVATDQDCIGVVAPTSGHSVRIIGSHSRSR